ncbi:GlxA family transcriptional regulator [Streptomyces sp. NPDC092046]|uniref:GlxA family transcriptional regulator n=1 Tax=Streptomyces sp. NPDC092046 TaxID=3366009 RepID=UPI00381D0A12
MTSTRSHQAPAAPHDVWVFAFDGVRLLDVSAPLEVFATAGTPYRVRVCTPDGRDVRTSCWLRIGADGAAGEVAAAGTLIVPGAVEPARCVAAGRPVAELAARSARVASVCTGAFALAAAGLLDGRRATTHWEHAAELARRHPAVEVLPDAIHVRDGEVWSSAGVTAGIDLCLALLEEDRGAAAARAVARDLVVFLQRPGGQSQFSAVSRTPPTGHPVVRPLLDAVAADPAADHSAPVLARRAGVSVRHLARLFREQTGATPAAYVERVRVEAARLLLEGGASVTGAAARSGLGSDESLRRAFARHFGVTPSAYLARFRTSAYS